MTEESTAVLELKVKLADQKANSALFAALAKAQGEFKPVAKNRAVQIRMKEGGTYRFEYADLEQLISCTRPALAANGLAVVQRVTEDALTTDLLHAKGGRISSRTELPRMGQDPKAYGAAITYLRRYAYSALLCLAADDDLDEDGQEAGDTGEQQRPQRTAKTEPKARTEKPAEGVKLASTAQLNWAKTRLADMDQEAGIKLLEKHGLKSLDTELTAAAFEALKKDLLS